MSENQMNNCVSEQVNNKEEEPQIFTEMTGTLTQLPVSIFNNILERKITNILNNEIDEDIEPKELLKYAEHEYSNMTFEEFKSHAKGLKCVIKHLEKKLKEDIFCTRCMDTSKSQIVITSSSNKLNKAIAHEDFNKEHEIFTLLKSEDEPDAINYTSKIQSKHKNIIDLSIDTQKYEPNLKSKINVSIPDVNTISNDKVLPINTEARTTLSNVKCLSSTIKRKHKSEPKSKTMLINNKVSSDAKNKKTVQKEIRLKIREIINKRNKLKKKIIVV